MIKRLVLRLVIPLVSAISALSLTACGSTESPAADTVADLVAADSASDSQPVDISDISADAPTDASTDADEDIQDTTVTTDVYDTPDDGGMPDVPPITVRGMFRLDWVETEAAGRDQFVPLTESDHGIVAVNDCGKMGMVYVDKLEDLNHKFSTSLMFSEIELAAPPDIDTPVSRVSLYTESGTDQPAEMHPSIVYDDCVPLVVNETASGFQMTKVGGGLIEWAPVDLGTQYTDVENFGAMIGRDGKIHLIFRGRPTGGTMKWVDAIYNGTTWAATELPPADTAMDKVIGVAISENGTMFVGYTRKNAQNQLEAWAAHHNGTAWEKQQIPDVIPSEFGLSFALGAYNREGVAWTQTVVSDDGFILSAGLKYSYRGTNNLFKTESIVVENDGYAGGAGNRMTGAAPQLVIDMSGRPHIMFSDLAVTVSGGKQTVSAGQLRYMWRKNDAWAAATVHRQDSPAGNRVDSIAFKAIGLNGTGNEAGIVAVAVATDSDGTVGLDTLGWSIQNTSDL